MFKSQQKEYRSQRFLVKSFFVERVYKNKIRGECPFDERITDAFQNILYPRTVLLWRVKGSNKDLIIYPSSE